MFTKNQERAFFEKSKEFLAKEPVFTNKDEAKKIADQLRELITFHEWKYYVQNAPLISDFEYDMLYKQLEKIEREYPELVTPDSPTQRVSPDLTSDFKKVTHIQPMLSLDNSYNEEDLEEFDTQIKKMLLLDENVDVEYVVEPKYDGGTIVLVYEHDRLVSAATRGNGTVGEEITNNARTIRSIPLKAGFSKYGITKVELRGEVVIRKDIFEKINKELAQKGEKTFSNPRNTATGSLRMKDPKITAQRGLTAFIFQFGYAEGEFGNDISKVFKTHDESIRALSELGFKVPIEETKVCKNIEEVGKYNREWEQKREQYDFEIDGMVIKVNSLEDQKRCGSTGHHPRWAIAFKFKAKQATTKLLRVEYQVGKTGAVTPVAKLEPVALAGVTISSVSLHNEDFIKEKDLRINDMVLVERAGDVIPYISQSLKDLRSGDEVVIHFPKDCPVCHTPLAKPEHEAKWRCVNYNCKAQVLQRMIHFVSKDGMDIDGFGKAYVEKFYEMGWLKNLTDIYQLDYAKIAELEGFGKKSADNLKDAIEKSKHNPIHRLLQSLSIPNLGKKIAKLLAAEIDHVLDLSRKTVEELSNVKDIGPIVAENTIAFFQNEANIHLLQEMERLGVNMKQTPEDRPKVVSEDAVFSGKTILFTGKLHKMTRKQAQEMAEAAGAKNISAVSSNLDYLVVGEKAGSKLKKAKALGTVTIITEDEFLALMEK